MFRTHSKAQSTLEYSLLAVAMALAVGLFLKKFDVVNTVFKNHFNEASMIMAKAKAPLPYRDGGDNSKGKVLLDIDLYYGKGVSDYMSDGSASGLAPDVQAWIKAKISPVVAQYKGQIYAYAQAYVWGMVSRGELSPLAAQYAMQSLQGYLDFDPKKDDVSWDMIGNAQQVYAELMNPRGETDTLAKRDDI